MQSSTSNADQMPTSACATEPSWNSTAPTRPVTPNSLPPRISLTVELSLQTMNGLMDILVTISRIGAHIDFVSAQANSVVLSVSAKPFVVKRVPFLLRELVEVMSVREI